MSRISIAVAAAVLAGGVITYNRAEDKESPAPLQIQAEQVESMYNHALPIPDLSSGMSGNAQYRVRASRHDVGTQVEIHTLDTDIFQVTSGEAIFVAGGKIVNAKNVGPDEIRGVSIDGGKTYHLKKGDIMIVPRGIPHWFQKIPSPPFLFVEVKVR